MQGHKCCVILLAVVCAPRYKPQFAFVLVKYEDCDKSGLHFRHSFRRDLELDIWVARCSANNMSRGFRGYEIMVLKYTQ
jgi:hypothetical protein